MINDDLSNTSLSSPPSQSITFNAYAFRKTGIIQSSTYIRIENYYLICIPWKISYTEMYLIVSLNAKERELFQKYRNTHCSVFVTCQNNGRIKAEFKILIQTTIRQIGPVAGKDNVCFIQLSIRTCPEPLAAILDDYLKHYQIVKDSYRNYSGSKVILDSMDTVRLLGFNDYAEIHLGNREIPVRVLSLSVDGMEFIVSSVHGATEDLTELNVKLYFQQNRFIVRGRVLDSEPFGNIYRKFRLELDFSPDLVDILELYFAVNSRKIQTATQNIVNGIPILDHTEEFEELEII